MMILLRYWLIKISLTNITFYFSIVWYIVTSKFILIFHFIIYHLKPFSLSLHFAAAEHVFFTFVSLIICQWFIVVHSSLTLCDPMDGNMPGFSVLHHLLELAQTHVHRLDAIQPSHPLSPPYPLPSIFPRIWVFSNGLPLHIRWPEYWSFSLSISPSNVYSGSIYFRIDWFDLLPVQRTFKSLLQYNSLKSSILWCSAFFMVQFSHPYMTTGKP